MGIVTRFMRLCRADVHGVLDQLEDEGLVLAQCLREMERELDGLEALRERLAQSLETTRGRLAAAREELDRLEADCALALEGGRDDIARFLIRKIRPAGAHVRQLVEYAKELEAELGRADDACAQRRQEFEATAARARVRMAREEHEARVSPTGASRMAAPSPSDEEVELELLRRKRQKEEAHA